MSLLRHAPRFDAATAERLARELYGLDATASPLPGERDQNFLLEGPAERGGGCFALKIANAAEDRAILEAQNALLDHVAPLGIAPRLVRTTSGEPIACGPGGHLIRLLTWVPGVPLASIVDPADAQLADLGRRLGQLDRVLAGFDHPALHRDFHWDLAQAFGVIGEHSRRIADDGLRGLVERIAAHVESRDGHLLRRLRRSVIHGDPNDHNVIVRGVKPGTPPSSISGTRSSATPLRILRSRLPTRYSTKATIPSASRRPLRAPITPSIRSPTTS